MQDYFRSLEDPRSIVISICAVIAGADGPKAIDVWALSREAWLLQHLELPRGLGAYIDAEGDLEIKVIPAGKRSPRDPPFAPPTPRSRTKLADPPNGPRVILRTPRPSPRRRNSASFKDWAAHPLRTGPP